MFAVVSATMGSVRRALAKVRARAGAAGEEGGGGGGAFNANGELGELDAAARAVGSHAVSPAATPRGWALPPGSAAPASARRG
jgi:hypothetical protein